MKILVEPVDGAKPRDYDADAMKLVMVLLSQCEGVNIMKMSEGDMPQLLIETCDIDPLFIIDWLYYNTRAIRVEVYG